MKINLDNYYSLDISNKKIDRIGYAYPDAFIKSIGKIKDIKIEEKTKDNKKFKIITITNEFDEDTILTLDEDNSIIKYQNDSIKEIGDYFLEENETLEEFIAPSLKKIGKLFLDINNSLKKLRLESVREIKNYPLSYNKVLQVFFAPNLEIIDTDFLENKKELKEFVALKLSLEQYERLSTYNKWILIKSNIKYLLYKIFDIYKKENIKDNEDIKNVKESDVKSVFLNDILRLIENVKKHQYKGYENDLNLLKELACDYMKVKVENVCKSEFEVYMSDSTLIERLVKLELSIEASINNYLYMKDDLEMLDKINSKLRIYKK